MHRFIVAFLAAFDAVIAVTVGLAVVFATLTMLWLFGLGGGAGVEDVLGRDRSGLDGRDHGAAGRVDLGDRALLTPDPALTRFGPVSRHAQPRKGQ